MTGQEAFSAKVNDLIEQSKKLSPEAERIITKLLEDADRQILGMIASLDPSSYSSAQLANLRASITRILSQFSQQATSQVNQLQIKAYQIGDASFVAPIAAAWGGAVPIGSVNQQTLSIVQGYTADLISGLSSDASARINATLQRAFLGGQTIGQIIDQVGRSLSTDGKFSGVFDSVGNRAISIATNEVMRVQSIAAQARAKDLAQRHAGLKKQWVHIPAAKVPRITHILADEQIVSVDEPFSVDGEELMFPRDPSGSPENTINCHCLIRPYLDRSQMRSTQADRDLLSSLGISVTVSNS